MMDFDKYLTRVQTSLRSIERRVGKFIQQPAQDFNELNESNKEVEEAVNLFVDSLKELNPEPEKLRNIHLYLLINTDFECNSLLQNDINICHLLNTIPKLSTYMYFQIINNTKMHLNLSEIIQFCPEVLVIDLLKCLSVNLRFFKVDIANDFLNSIFDGLYKKILILQKSDNENIKQKFVKVLQTFSEFSIFEIVNKTDWDVVKKQCYYGHHIKMWLNLVQNCSNYFNSNFSPESIEVYKFKMDYDYNSWNVVTKEDNWSIYCLHVLINKCYKVLKEVNVDIYMAWCEEEYNNDTVNNLQMKIRLQAYTCKEVLQSLSNYSDKLASLNFLVKDLENIAVKPVTEDDEMINANTEVIAKNMKDSSKSQLKWLKLFLNIDKILLENRCLDDLKCVVTIFTKSTTLELIGIFNKHIASNELPEKSVEAYKELILNCVKQLKKEEQIEILNTVASQGNNTLKTQHFTNNVSETLNKLVGQSKKMDKVMQEVILLALESGRELVELMFIDCLKGISLCDIFVQVLLDLSVLTTYKTSSTDDTLLCQHLTVQHFKNIFNTDLKNKDNLIHMIKKFSYFSIIDGKSFIINQLIPEIQKNVPLKQWQNVELCLEIFEVFIDGSGGAHVSVCEAEIIAFFATLLNKCRLQPSQITVHSSLCVLKTNNFLFNLTNNFLQNKKDYKTDREACWLREKLSNMSPLTWFPMRKLWAHMEHPPDPNNQLIIYQKSFGQKSLFDLDDRAREKLVIHICKILPLLSTSEWKLIGYDMSGSDRASLCLNVYHILADCILVLNQIPSVYSNTVCMTELICGFCFFFKFKVINALKYKDRRSCLEVLNKQVIVVNELSSEVVNLRMAAISSVFQDIVQLVIDKASKDQHHSDLLSTVASLKESQIQSMLSNRLLKSLSV